MVSGGFGVNDCFLIGSATAGLLLLVFVLGLSVLCFCVVLGDPFCWLLKFSFFNNFFEITLT